MKTILVIEDETPIRAYIFKLLKAEGYRVFSAKDGDTGLILATDLHPDLIVCDVVMPKLNGYRVQDALRQNRSTANIPFLFLSAQNDPCEHCQNICFASDHYLTKPIIRHDLLNAVSDRLAIFDRQKAKTLAMKKLAELDRLGWAEFKAAQQQLEQVYCGWQVAIDLKTGERFLVKDQEDVSDSAKLVLPGQAFEYRKITNS
jgi:CheY-like chemotaxis protein